MAIICTNPECEAYEVEISNETGMPTEGAYCGQCGNPLTDDSARIEHHDEVPPARVENLDAAPEVPPDDVQ
jgi:hypothetical protein